MKRLIIGLALLFAFTVSNAQVFGTAHTLKKGTGNFGILPTIIDMNGTNDFMLFLQGGYGLTSGVDLGVKLGFLTDENYIGADVEFALGKNFSLATGAHSFYEFGLDATVLYTISLNNNVRFTPGLDVDFIFPESGSMQFVWIPLNLEVDIKKNMVFIFEADIDTKLIDESFNLISAGVQFYF